MNISELDLQNLRHLITSCDTTYSKMNDYAEQTQDQNVKQYFQKSAQSAKDTKQTLMQFLQ